MIVIGSIDAVCWNKVKYKNRKVEFFMSWWVRLLTQDWAAFYKHWGGWSATDGRTSPGQEGYLWRGLKWGGADSSVPLHTRWKGPDKEMEWWRWSEPGPGKVNAHMRSFSLHQPTPARTSISFALTWTDMETAAITYFLISSKPSLYIYTI